MRTLGAPAPCCCLHPPHSAGTLEAPLQGGSDGAAVEEEEREEEEEDGDGGDGCAAAAGLQCIYPTVALRHTKKHQFKLKLHEL